MDKKYHIRSDGSIGRCTATINECPIGGVHFSNPEDAIKEAEKRLAKTSEKFISFSKEPPSEIEIGYSEAVYAEETFGDIQELLQETEPGDCQVRLYDGSICGETMPCNIHNRNARGFVEE